MRTRSALGVLAAAALVPMALPAQDTPNAVYQVVTLEHTPSTMVQWRNTQAKLAEVMKATGLPAAEVGWWTYVKDNRTIIVRPRTRDALFPGPGGMGRLRQADSAKAAEVGRGFEGTQLRLVSNEVVEHAPNLSYTPATEMTTGGVSVYGITIAPGQGGAFNRAIRAMNEVRTAVGYPYSVQLFRVRMGATRTEVVTFVDSFEAYYGKNSMERLLEGKPALQQQWQEAINGILTAVSGWTSWTAGYAVNMSYPPM